MKKIFLFLITTCLCCFSNAQSKWKFGKVSKEELLKTKCEFYPEANAMILKEKGELNFQYSQDAGWQFILETVVRKKIFNSNAKDAGSIKIKIYEPLRGSNKEEIKNLKAYTYNLEGGKVEKVKLSNSEEYETRINDYWKEVSFTLPDIQEGSVIEYRYTLVSDYLFNLKTWHFQSDIPVKESYFVCTTPEFFQYQPSQVGSLIDLSSEKSVKDEVFNYKYNVSLTDNIGSGSRTTNRSASLNSRSVQRKLLATNVLPIENEPYMANKSDIPARLEFQLISYNFPNRAVEYVAGDYTKFNFELLDREDFGARTNKGGFAKDWGNTISEKNDFQKADFIYKKIANTISWNSEYGITSNKAGNNIYKTKNGSVADINLTLVAALVENGIEAMPLILSTRGHGTVHPIYPDYSDFNYIVCAVKIDDKLYFCDATTDLPFGVLPWRCLNGNGWLISKDGGSWISLKSNSVYSSTTMIQLSIEDEELISKAQIKRAEYSAVDAIYEIKKSGEEVFKQQIEESLNDWELENFEIDEKSYSTIKMSYRAKKEIDGNDIIYLNPISYGQFGKNPFKRERRFSNIDFPYGYNYKVIVQLEIPEGYVAELPESTSISLPDDAGKFTYTVKQNNSLLQILSDFSLSKKEFVPQQYSIIKEFFEVMSSKNDQLIILRKT